jgi:hypothetical protein
MRERHLIRRGERAKVWERGERDRKREKESRRERE